MKTATKCQWPDLNTVYNNNTSNHTYMLATFLADGGFYFFFFLKFETWNSGFSEFFVENKKLDNLCVCCISDLCTNPTLGICFWSRFGRSSVLKHDFSTLFTLHVTVTLAVQDPRFFSDFSHNLNVASTLCTQTLHTLHTQTCQKEKQKQSAHIASECFCSQT